MTKWIVLPKEIGHQKVEIQDFHVWLAVCALGKCCVLDERGFYAEEAEGELLQEVLEMSWLLAARGEIYPVQMETLNKKLWTYLMEKTTRKEQCISNEKWW